MKIETKILATIEEKRLQLYRHLKESKQNSRLENRGERKKKENPETVGWMG